MRDDRGAAAIAMSAMAALVAVITVAVVSLGLAYAARSKASTAADAAALAAAVATYPAASSTTPMDAAGAIARANDSLLISCSCRVDPTLSPRVVMVMVGIPIDIPLFGEMTIRAGARAEFDPRRWLGR